jgi:uncharacterized coiled-coil DUF342 family protein
MATGPTSPLPPKEYPPPGEAFNPASPISKDGTKKKGILKKPTKELELVFTPKAPTPAKVQFVDKKVRIIHTRPTENSDYDSGPETPLTPTEMVFSESTKKAHKIAEKNGKFEPLVQKSERYPRTSTTVAYHPTTIKEIEEFRKTLTRLDKIDPEKMSLENLQDEIKYLKIGFNKLTRKVEHLYSGKGEAFHAHDPYYKQIVEGKHFQTSLQEEINEYVETISALEEVLFKKMHERESEQIQQRIEDLTTLRDELQKQSHELLSKKTPLLQRLVKKTNYQAELTEIIARHNAEIDRLVQTLQHLHKS